MSLNTTWTSNFDCDETTQSVDESQEVHKVILWLNQKQKIQDIQLFQNYLEMDRTAA